MFKRGISIIMLSVLVMTAYAQTSANKAPLRVIFDTDMATDYDDVGAITILHYYAAHGKAHILATIASSRHNNVAPVLNVLNTYFGMPDLPIGVPTGKASALSDPQKWSDSLIAKYPHKIKFNAEVMDAVKLYRKVLARQPDHSVTLITVGFFTNIANLLKSGPDEFSSLTGQQLVDRKVVKMISMAGKFPYGSEYNMSDDSAASKYVFSHFTRPVIFSGFEIGVQIHTGLPLIHDNNIVNDPVKDVFSISMPKSPDDANGRMSWDETAVYVAIHGPAPYYKLVSGKVKLDAHGADTWITAGNQFYLKAIRPPSDMQQVIDKLIMYQPGK